LPFLYQFSDGYLYRFNVATGNYDDSDVDGVESPDNLYLDDVGRLPGANGVGYNPADNYIYAIASSKLWRVGSDGFQDLGSPSGSATLYNTAGDFIADNVLLTSSGNDFSKITISGDTSVVEVYTPRGATWSPADFTVDRNGTFAYGMSGTKLFRLTISTGLVETQNVTMTGNNGGTGWGSAYATSNGDLFFYQNTNGGANGQIWKIASAQVSSFSHNGSNLTASREVQNQSLSTPNDGASCPTAANPFDPPLAVGDAYAHTTGTTFSADAESLGLIAGDSQSSTGAVLYKVGLSSDLTTNIVNRLPSDSSRTSSSVASATNTSAESTVTNSGPTLEITDWDTGEFEVTNLDLGGGSFTFYYQLVEETKSVFETTRRLSNVGTVTIDSLTINRNGPTDPVTLPSGTQYQTYSGHSFVANNDASETSDDYFWKASHVITGNEGSLPDAPPLNTSLPAGFELNGDTGALSGVPNGSELSSDASYTIRVFAALDNQFKTFTEENFTLTVQTPTQYTLTYNTNGQGSPTRATGSPPASVTSARTTVSGAGSLADPCYTFAGWDTAANGSGVSLDAGNSVTFTNATLPAGDDSIELSPANTTLYAQWTDARVGVTYSVSGQTSGTLPTDSTRYCNGDVVTVLGNPNSLTRTNFRFLGWSTTNGSATADYPVANPGIVTASTSAITLFGVWASEHTITYNSNQADSGTVPTDTSRYIQGESVTAQANSGSLTRAGFTFRGWNTAANGSGTQISPSATFVMPGSNTTLYADWASPTSPSPTGGTQSSPGTPTTTPRGGTQSSPGTPTTTPAEELLAPRVRRTAPAVPMEQTPRPPSPTDSSRELPPATETPTLAIPAPTLDVGGGIVEQAEGQNVESSLASSRRTLAEVGSEKIGGFLPTAAITIEVRGARTGARFVTDAEMLTNPPLLLEQVALSSRSSVDTFFALENLSLANAPTGLVGALPEDEARVVELFSSAGLERPQTISQDQQDALGVEGWIRVDTTVREYKPGSFVYLIVNSEPLIVGFATVGEDGTAQVAGDIPIGWFGIGEHRIRAVGVKEFDGIQVGQDGELVIPDEVLEKIQQFDLGTQVTVIASGPNPQGSNHLALRVVPLEPTPPWWTLWIIAVTALLMIFLRLRGVLATRSQAAVGAFSILLSSLPAIILGWTSTVTVVAVVGGVLALVLGATNVLAPIVSNRRKNPQQT
jgi:uncharacterized repeat protein (TIGR02543 family)